MVALLSVPSFAQEFNLSGEIRPRYENRYGFSSLRSEADKAGNFISQRSRINFDFKNEKMIFKVLDLVTKIDMALVHFVPKRIKQEILYLKEVELISILKMKK